jgi:hypothetical protein
MYILYRVKTVLIALLTVMSRKGPHIISWDIGWDSQRSAALSTPSPMSSVARSAPEEGSSFLLGPGPDLDRHRRRQLRCRSSSRLSPPPTLESAPGASGSV